MRRLLLVAALLAAIPAWAQKIDRIQILTQGEFRLLSEDLGGALSYKPIIPTTPLGSTGFDIGIALTAARLQNTEILERASSDDVPSTLPVPTLRAYKGLPLGFDVGLLYSQIPGTDIKFYGGELRYAIIGGGLTMPAIGIRGAFTKVSGIDQINFNTRSVDLSVSKGFPVVTPYAGLGYVWVSSDPKGNGGLSKEDFGMTKWFVGLGFNVALFNFAVEADRTGDVASYSAKVGLRF